MTKPYDKEQKRLYYLRNAERIKAERRKYVAKYPERVKAVNLAYYRRVKTTPEYKAKEHEKYLAKYANPEWRKSILSKAMEWQRKNRKKASQRTIRWNRKHPEIIRAWRERNRDLIHRSLKKTRLKNAARVKAYDRKRRLEHPEAFRAYAKKRRALKAKATINLRGITSFMEKAKGKPFAICYYCLKRFDSKRIHFDHIVALSKGGSHSVDNLCVACPECNLSKHNKDIVAWISTGQQLLSI